MHRGLGEGKHAMEQLGKLKQFVSQYNAYPSTGGGWHGKAETVSYQGSAEQNSDPIIGLMRFNI